MSEQTSLADLAEQSAPPRNRLAVRASRAAATANCVACSATRIRTRQRKCRRGGARGEPEVSPVFLEVAAERLLALDRLEQRLEVAVAEAARAVALDHLEEERRPVLRRLREDLEEVTLVVAIGEDPQPPQVGPVLVDLADAA